MSDSVRILLVEDDEGDAFIIQTLLEEGERAYDITRVALMKEAFELVEAEDFDLVMLDLSLPDSTGLETFTQMERRAPNVPIVVMTGVTDEAIARKAVNLGAQDFLVQGSLSGASLNRAIGYAMEIHDAT